MGLKCSMSFSLSCLIEPRDSHHPFVFLHTTTTPFSTTFLMQTMHHPPTPHTILTTHTWPTSSPYQPPAFHVNVEPQHNTFPIPLNNAHVRLFGPSIMLTLIVSHDQTPQPTPTFPTCLQFPPRASCPICDCQFNFWRLTNHQFPVRHLIHLI
jgi:hypothetical protein